MKLPRWALLIAWLSAAFAACTRVEQTDEPPGVTLGEAGSGGQAPGGSGSLAGEGGDGHGGGAIAFGGAPDAIDLGLWPTFASPANASGDAAAVIAAVSALSAGSAMLPLYERWDALSGATGSPRAVTWNRLDAVTAPYIERGADLALCIGVVDRAGAAWPFLEDLDSDAAAAAIERTIDEVFNHFAAHLSHLCFGYEVDRYLADATSSDAARLLGFLEHAVQYTRAHPLYTRHVVLGVSITLDAAAGGELNLEEVALGDELVAVYDPLDASGELKAPGSVTDELEAALAAVPVRGGAGIPFTLFEAGYPSSEAVGSSEEDQRDYYAALLGALEQHADQVSFVGLFGLGDRATAECETEAASFAKFETERALARCSMGLRAEDGTARLAWPNVVSALSRYR